MSLQKRILAACAIGAAAAILCYTYQLGHGASAGDLWIPLCMARALLGGAEPYAACRSVHSDGVTPATANPLTTGLAMLPFAPLPDPVVAAVVFGLSSGLLAFGLARDGAWRLLVFLAFPYWESLRWVQWAPLLMAVALFPALLPLTLIKPHVGLPIALTRLTWRRALACAAFGLLSLAIEPSWPWRWLGQVGDYTGFVPLLALPGPLLLLALLRWRSPDARLFTLLALAPQRIYYDQLLLFVLPRGARELLALSAISWLVFFGGELWPGAGRLLVVALLYGAALVLLLRRRPGGQGLRMNHRGTEDTEGRIYSNPE